MMRVGKDSVTAFRLNAHHLIRRLPEGSLVQAAAACGIQDTPPGSALLALHARVGGVTGGQLDDEIATSRRLLRTWCMRGAPFVVPAADAAVFTIGLLPDAEAARQRFVQGVGPALARMEMSLDEAVERTEVELRAILFGRRLTIRELGSELAEAISPKLPSRQRGVWRSQGPYAPGQPVGEAVVHFVLRIVSLKGTICFAPRSENEAPFVLTDEWLGRPVARSDPDAARAELVRRYLRCYGPSTREDFAAWAGLGPGDADGNWKLVEEELSSVDFDGRTAWILARDLDALATPSETDGVRLLPPHDPFVQQRDRRTLVEERDVRRRVWRSTGDPGTVLAGGRLVATWRPRKVGARLSIEVEAFDGLTPGWREPIEAEAADVARLRGAPSSRVIWSGLRRRDLSG